MAGEASHNRSHPEVGGMAGAECGFCSQMLRASCPPKGVGSELSLRLGTHTDKTEAEAPPSGAELHRQPVSLGVVVLKSCLRKPADNFTSMESRKTGRFILITFGGFGFLQ